MKAALSFVTISILTFLLASHSALALDPSLDVSQYAHTAWTVRDGFSLGNIYAMAPTPDGYLWLGSEFGLFRFDGVRAIQWQPPAGQQLPDRNVNSLLVTRDGALWTGTMAGLVALRRGNLSSPPVMSRNFVASLFEDHNGTVDRFAGRTRDMTIDYTALSLVAPEKVHFRRVRIMTGETW